VCQSRLRVASQQQVNQNGGDERRYEDHQEFGPRRQLHPEFLLGKICEVETNPVRTGILNFLEPGGE
jgi:hypothetical protein